jgi:pyrroline-5-carboxylate reductase
MKAHNIAFIGGGNMARSIIGGLITEGWPQENISVSDPDPSQLEIIQKYYARVRTTQNNHICAKQADVIFFAVKPQALREAAKDISGIQVDDATLIISIAAGVRCTTISTWLGRDCALVRCMPNTPAVVGSGATGLYANALVSDEQHDTAERILRTVGLTLWFDAEALLDAVTALSGSGPAYFLLIMEAMQSAGAKLGLSREAARLLTLQTAFGSAKLALESSEDVTTLRARVTSPGGTTERAIEQLERGDIRNVFERAMNSAFARSIELADELGKD